MVVEHDVDVLEEAGAHEIRLGAEQFLGDAGPDHQRAGQLLALHEPLHRQRGDDVERRARVVAFTVARRAIDHRVVVRDARLLVALRDAVDIRAERDHRLAAAPRRHPRAGDTGHAVFHREPVLAQQAAEVFLRLELLKSDLREAEDHVVHLLAEIEHGRRRHVGIDERLELRHARVDRRGRRGSCGRRGGRTALRQRRRDHGRGHQTSEHETEQRTGHADLRAREPGRRRALSLHGGPGKRRIVTPRATRGVVRS